MPCKRHRENVMCIAIWPRIYEKLRGGRSNWEKNDAFNFFYIILHHIYWQTRIHTIITKNESERICADLIGIFPLFGPFALLFENLFLTSKNVTVYSKTFIYTHLLASKCYIIDKSGQYVEEYKE